MNILALDLGTSTGYAAGDTDGSNFIMGSWLLATKKEVTQWGKQRLTRRRDPRPRRLCDQILGLKYLPDLVVFEDVQFASSTLQVQLWSALRTSLWMCFGSLVKFECVPVKTLKKFATGAGYADKIDMAAAFSRDNLTPLCYTDDAIDAYFVWKWAKQNLSRMQL